MWYFYILYCLLFCQIYSIYVTKIQKFINHLNELFAMLLTLASKYIHRVSKRLMLMVLFVNCFILFFFCGWWLGCYTRTTFWVNDIERCVAMALDTSEIMMSCFANMYVVTQKYRHWIPFNKPHTPMHLIRLCKASFYCMEV